MPPRSRRGGRYEKSGTLVKADYGKSACRQAIRRGVQKAPAFAFRAAKNEYESAQVIITAAEDIRDYRLELSHIQSENRMYYIWKDCFTVYHQKYIEIKQNSKGAEEKGFGKGFYPDALLPFEKAVKYGENKVEQGKNQAIFISLRVPKDQPAGKYAGEFRIIADGETYSVPVSVEVWDFTVPDEVHCKSDFVIGTSGLKLGENDYFPQMYRKYAEKLIEFRLAPHRVMQLLNLPYNEGEDFVREVRYFTQEGKPELSTIMLPVYPHPVTGIDEANYKNLFWRSRAPVWKTAKIISKKRRCIAGSSTSRSTTALGTKPTASASGTKL